MSQPYPYHHGGGQSSHSPSQQPQSQNQPPPALNNNLPSAQAQPMAPQQNAAVPPNPMDMLAKMNISPEQFMQIAQLIQSGAMPLHLFNPAAPPQTAVPAPMPTQAVQPPAPYQVHSNGQDVDMDKEEGEVEEDSDEEDVRVAVKPSGFLSTPPKGPRKRSRSPQPRFGENLRTSHARVRSPVHPSAAATRRSSALGRPEAARPGPSDSGRPRPAQTLQQNGQAPSHKVDRATEASEFVRTLYKHGYTYHQILESTKMPERAFRRFWIRLGLPPGAVQPRALNQTAAQNGSLAESSASAAPAVAVKRAPPAKPAATQDRSAYLAKLQAAKNKKSEPATTTPSQPQTADDTALPSKPQPAPAVASPSSQLSQPSQLVPPMQAPSPRTQQPKRAIDNNLVRQKLMALKAAQAAKKNGQNATAPSNATGDRNADIKSDTDNEPGDGNVGAIVDRNASPTMISSPVTQAVASPTMSRANGLPGLFTANPALTASPTQQQEIYSSVAQAPVPTVNTFGSAIGQYQNSAPPLPPSASGTPGTGVPKRPFGLSRSASDEERVIIVDSDEESDDGVRADGNITEQFEKRTLSANPMNAFPVQVWVPKGSGSSAPGTPSTPNPAAEKAEKKLAEAKKKLEAMERKRQQRLKREAAGDASVRQVIDAGANPTSSVSASEAGTPATDHASYQTADETFLLQPTATVAESAFDAIPISSSDVPEPESRPAESNAAPLQGTIEQTYIDSNSLASTGHQQDDQSNVMEDAAQNDGGNSSLRGADAVQVDSAATVAPQQPDLDAGDMDIDDDDDFDDLYAQSTPAAQNAPATAITQAEFQSQEADDSESDMDTSSDTSDEFNKFYKVADTDVGLEKVLPLPQPQLPSPEPRPDESGDGDDSLDDSTGPERTNVDTVKTPSEDRVNDELAPELQPSKEELAVPEVQPAKTSRFTPYVSPLWRFKDFRYHPQFLEVVPGGFKSKTYNHKIDPSKVLCPYETAGGKCNDKTCEFQHFKAMSLSDNELLKLMGADQIPAKLPEDVKKWKQGLGALITRIRNENQGRDVELISKRIAEYRREFVSDPSKTLLLD